ncbi:hypothetical protein [Sulfitobacter sp. MF3-043]|uniref:hypothetical protein n=1 Tax=Sulfitobacter sediminivivens TaxID=3252902 RepID=UPI003EBB92D1
MRRSTLWPLPHNNRGAAHHQGSRPLLTELAVEAKANAMKVTRNTLDQLIISDTLWLISIALTCFILIFVAAGLFAASEIPWLGFPFAANGAGI